MSTTRPARYALVSAAGIFCLAVFVFSIARQDTAAQQSGQQSGQPSTGLEGMAPAEKRRGIPGGKKDVVFDEAAMADLLRKEHSKHKLAALLRGIWHGDDELLTIAVGDSMAGVPAARPMHFRTGGVTLTCVSAMLLRLADAGKVSPDDKLARWYPKLPKADEVTLRMLANCTSGYPDYVLSKAFVADFLKDPFRQWTSQELIDVAMASPLRYKPGTGWNYSHTNFVILGEVLQKVSGLPMADLLDREVCRPLGLKETEFPTNATLRFPALHAFSTDRGIYEDSTYWSPTWTSYSGQMTSTLRDLGVLARAIGSGTLLSEKSRREQVAPTTIGLGKNRADRYYGMGIILLNGWMVQNPRFGGYNLIFAHLPERKISIVVVTTLGAKADPEPAYSTVIFRELVERLTPDVPLPADVK